MKERLFTPVEGDGEILEEALEEPIQMTLGWIPFAYVPLDAQKEAGITDSVVVKFVLAEFWNELYVKMPTLHGSFRKRWKTIHLRLRCEVAPSRSPTAQENI